MTNLAGSLDYHADQMPNRVVITDGERTLTNRQLLERVSSVGEALRIEGIGPDDVVAILMANHAEYIECVFAINRIGAIFLPLNVRLAGPELQYILDHAGVSAVIADLEYVDLIDSLQPSLPSLRTKVLRSASAAGSWLAYEDLAGRTGAVCPLRERSDYDLQRLMYTSGTTSRPKGVCISHGNVAWKNMAHIVRLGLSSEERTAVAGPLYHVGGLDMGGLTTLYAGGALVLLRKFDPVALLQTVEAHRVTSVWLAPSMVNAVLETPDLHSYDISSLRLIMSGGEKMPEARMRAIVDAMPQVWVADAYGLTETVSGDTFLAAEDMQRKLGSVGKPVLHQEIRIVDGDGRAVPAGTLGEITLRGPKVSAGYWRDPEATEAAIRDGWLHTGDIGRLDEDGYLYIEDRKKDMIVSGGENIASPEVERVLWEHPDVVEAAVVGTFHPKWGEVPKAFVVLRQNATVTADELIAFCDQRLARFKVPRVVVMIDSLPRTPSGKVLKRGLRDGADGPELKA